MTFAKIYDKLSDGLIVSANWCKENDLSLKLFSFSIDDLNRLGIMDYVVILEVTKNGTIKSKN